jgi:predicted phage tail protein
LRKIFFLLLALSSFANEIEQLSNKVDSVIVMMRENNKLLTELIKSETETNRELIRANQEMTNKRFEAMDKRFESMQKSIDKRFESMQNSIDKRFEAVDKRFDDVNKRFEDMNSKFNMIVTVMVAGFGLIMAYLIKERADITKRVEENIDEKLEVVLSKKADTKLVERVIYVLEKFAQKNRDIDKILKEHKLA